MRVEDLRAAGCQGVRLVVAEIVKEPGLHGFVGIRGVNAVDVGPDHEFVGVQDVRDDGTGKIGAVAAERGDAAVGSGADETGDHGNNGSGEQRDQQVAATALGLFQVRLGVAERVAGQNEFGRCDGNSGDAGALECGGKQARAEAFAERRQPVEQLWSGCYVFVRRDFVKQVAAERIEPVGDAVVRVGIEGEFAKNIMVQTEQDFGIGTRALIFAFGEKLRDGEEAIGYALHRGDDYDNVRAASDRLHQPRGVQHALSTEQ